MLCVCVLGLLDEELSLLDEVADDGGRALEASRARSVAKCFFAGFRLGFAADCAFVAGEDGTWRDTRS